MNNTSKFTTTLLVFLTALRALGTGGAGILSFQAGANQNVYAGIVSLLFSLLYVIGIAGILTKRKAAIATLIFLGVFDLLSAIQIGGLNGLGAVFFDVIIVYLAYKEYKNAGLKVK